MATGGRALPYGWAHSAPQGRSTSVQSSLTVETSPERSPPSSTQSIPGTSMVRRLAPGGARTPWRRAAILKAHASSTSRPSPPITMHGPPERLLIWERCWRPRVTWWRGSISDRGDDHDEDD